MAGIKSTKKFAAIPFIYVLLKDEKIILSKGKINISSHILENTIKVCKMIPLNEFLFLKISNVRHQFSLQVSKIIEKASYYIRTIDINQNKQFK